MPVCVKIRYSTIVEIHRSTRFPDKEIPISLPFPKIPFERKSFDSLRNLKNRNFHRNSSYNTYTSKQKKERVKGESFALVHHQLRVTTKLAIRGWNFSLHEEKEKEKEEGGKEGKRENSAEGKLSVLLPAPPWNSLQKSNLRIGLALVENGCPNGIAASGAYTRRC